MTRQALEPRLKASLLCERVIEDKEGVLTVVRIVDRLVIRAEGVNLPKDPPPQDVTITALMSWVGGLGTYEAKIRALFPDERKLETPTLPFYLDSLEKTQNFVLQLSLQVRTDGVYWFEFLLGDEVRNRIPLRVIYERVSRPGMKQA